MADETGRTESERESEEIDIKEEKSETGHVAGDDQGDTGSGRSPEELLLTLQDAQAKAEDYWNQLLRAKAEVANVQRRYERELENAHKYGIERFARELLPVIDSLDLGLAATGEGQADSDKVREGMALTAKMLSSAVEKFGITAIDPEGERFNPDFHQAMSIQEAADVEPNTVLTVYQKGYLLNDRLIRPAMVVVSSGGARKASDDGESKGQKPASSNKIDELA